MHGTPRMHGIHDLHVLSHLFQDVSMRIEHHCWDPVTGTDQILYLHNAEVKKPASNKPHLVVRNQSAVIIRNLKVVFSTVRSAQDIFKAMIVVPVSGRGEHRQHPKQHFVRGNCLGARVGVPPSRDW